MLVIYFVNFRMQNYHVINAHMWHILYSPQNSQYTQPLVVRHNPRGGGSRGWAFWGSGAPPPPPLFWGNPKLKNEGKTLYVCVHVPCFAK